MEAGNTQNNVTSDLYPGIRAIKTRNVCNFINRYAYELEEHEDIILFERVDVDPGIVRIKWIDRIFQFAKKWMEEEMD